MAKKMVLVPAEMMNDISTCKAEAKHSQNDVFATIREKVNLTEDNRVIYDDEVGSNLMDLIRYFVIPGLEKPKDAAKFAKLLRDSDVKWLKLK